MCLLGLRSKWHQAWFLVRGAPTALLLPAPRGGPSEKAMAPHSSTLAWKNPMDGGAWWAAVLGVAMSWTRLSNFTFTFPFHALEKEMATHSSVLAWRIPGMGEPGGLPSMGSHKVGHNWSDLAAGAAAEVAHMPFLSPSSKLAMGHLFGHPFIVTSHSDYSPERFSAFKGPCNYDGPIWTI